MQVLSKHRLERATYEIDFSSDLGTGETVVSGTVVVIRRRADGAWEDVTGEFREAEPPVAPNATGTGLLFSLQAAGAPADQLADASPSLAKRNPLSARHAVLATATTSAGFNPVATGPDCVLPALVVNGQAP